MTDGAKIFSTVKGATPMQAYLNDHSLKNATIAAMEADIKAEALVQGSYWNGTNGCFVGCVIRGESHDKFELALGIPRVLARLADRIFEELNYSEAKNFSLDFLKAIPVGADLTGVWPKFAHFMLVDAEHGVINFTKSERAKAAIQAVADLYQRKIDGEDVAVSLWVEARSNAYASDAYAYAAYACASYDYASCAADAASAVYDADAAAYAYAYTYAEVGAAYAVLASRLVRLLAEAV